MDDRIARGVNFVYAKEYVLGQYGEAGWARVLGRLPPEAPGVWGSTLLLTGTYSFAAFKALAGAHAAERAVKATRISRKCTSSLPTAASAASIRCSFAWPARPSW